MKKSLILTALLVMTFASTPNAEAARRNRTYTRSRAEWRSTSQRQGLWSRMVELERRKNAWLFGR